MNKPTLSKCQVLEIKTADMPYPVFVVMKLNDEIAKCDKAVYAAATRIAHECPYIGHHQFLNELGLAEVSTAEAIWLAEILGIKSENCEGIYH